MAKIEFDIKTDRLMTFTEIMSVLRKANLSSSRATMDRWIKSGYFPAPDFVIGRSGRWIERSFKAWLQKGVDDATRPGK